jgi:hypothetical protein
MTPGLFKLKIAKPCHENWDAMTVAENGRHCLSCNKNVIDFSILSNEQIQNYFIDNYGSEVCGRFRNAQLEKIRIQLPGYILKKKMAVWKKYLLIFLICFGSNLYSIDITVGNWQNSLHAQTHVSSTEQTKSKSKLGRRKKNQKKKNIIIVDFPSEECWTWGLTIPFQQEYVVFPFIDILNKSISDKNENPHSPTISFKPSSRNEDKKSEQKDKMEFLLPPPLNLRRRKR